LLLSVSETEKESGTVYAELQEPPQAQRWEISQVNWPQIHRKLRKVLRWSYLPLWRSDEVRSIGTSRCQRQSYWHMP